VNTSTSPASNRTRLVIALLVAAVGAVWTLQGLGVPIGGGFMVGNPTWIWIGAGLIVVAIVYAVWPRVRRR
jgi:ABC-type proline/glycine betaine transport system permease subunit